MSYENGTNIGNEPECNDCKHYEREVARLTRERDIAIETLGMEAHNRGYVEAQRDAARDSLREAMYAWLRLERLRTPPTHEPTESEAWHRWTAALGEALAGVHDSKAPDPETGRMPRLSGVGRQRYAGAKGGRPRPCRQCGHDIENSQVFLLPNLWA